MPGGSFPRRFPRPAPVSRKPPRHGRRGGERFPGGGAMSFNDLFWFFFIFMAVQPMIRQRWLEARRLRLLTQLERQRRSRVIALLHRQETMSLLGFPLFRYIDIQASEDILRAIKLTGDDVPIDL